jgi:hypothetical protein
MRGLVPAFAVGLMLEYFIGNFGYRSILLERSVHELDRIQKYCINLLMDITYCTFLLVKK